MYIYIHIPIYLTYIHYLCHKDERDSNPPPRPPSRRPPPPPPRATPPPAVVKAAPLPPPAEMIKMRENGLFTGELKSYFHLCMCCK